MSSIMCTKSSDDIFLPEDVIYVIFSFCMDENYRFLNKRIYNDWKHKRIQEFYTGVCVGGNRGRCGHKNITHRLDFTDSRMVEIDEGVFERGKMYQTRYICSHCFGLGLKQFVNKMGHIPYLRGEGRCMWNMIKKLRQETNEIEFLQWTTSHSHKQLNEISFHTALVNQKVFFANYYSKRRYEDLLANIHFSEQQ